MSKAVVFGLFIALCVAVSVIKEAFSPVPVTTEVAVRTIVDENEGWGTEARAREGDVVEFQVRFENSSDRPLRNARLTVALPNRLEYRRGTARLCSPTDTDGRECDGLFANKKDDCGADIGDYKPGEYSYVRFKAVVTDKADTGCYTVYVCTPNGAPDVADVKDVSIYVSSSDD